MTDPPSFLAGMLFAGFVLTTVFLIRWITNRG